jgi:hypothetical protein
METSSPLCSSYVELRTGARYEIRRGLPLAGYTLLDQRGQTAAWIGDQTGTACSAAGHWKWELMRRRGSWRLAIQNIATATAVLLALPRGEIVKYKLTLASDARAFKLRQNLFTTRWTLYIGKRTLATVAVTPQYYDRGQPFATPRHAGTIQLDGSLMAQSARQLTLIGMLLCIKLEASYRSIGGSAGP